MNSDIFLPVVTFYLNSRCKMQLAFVYGKTLGKLHRPSPVRERSFIFALPEAKHVSTAAQPLYIQKHGFATKSSYFLSYTKHVKPTWCPQLVESCCLLNKCFQFWPLARVPRRTRAAMTV